MLARARRDTQSRTNSTYAKEPLRAISLKRFRGEVCAIDHCVEEEFLKLYVAYKAETNFVDVVPQASGLRLSLNMKFHELKQPERSGRRHNQRRSMGQRRCWVKVFKVLTSCPM